MAGVLPFIASVLLLFAADDLRAEAMRSLLGYGAVILSFLGGVRWGLAIAESSPFENSFRNRQLVISVLPSIVAWMALLLPVPVSLWLLAASFLSLLWLDRRAGREGLMPGWYVRLRLPLSIAVVCSLILGISTLSA